MKNDKWKDYYKGKISLEEAYDSGLGKLVKIKEKEFEAVYQGPKEKYRDKIFKVKKEEDGTNTLIIDSKEGRKLLNVPHSDLRFVEKETL